MKFKDEENSVNLQEEVFKVDDKDFDSGWLWWFWLFFIDDPSEVKKPRQVAVLWSTKDDRSINCNGRRFELHREEDGNQEGVVACWYFDGDEMHHNFLLEKSDLNIGSDCLKMEGETYTDFRISDRTCEVTIGEEFEFKARPKEGYDFAINSRSTGDYPFGMSYSMLRSSRLDLESEIRGEVTEGSAYFQRVLVDAPAPSWYWGIFHFENGGFIDYYKPHIFGKSLKEEIAFYDGEETHEFEEVSVEREERGELPLFHITAETKDGNKEISFTVKPYSKASWKFQKKVAKIIPNKLTYREYPARISELELIDKKEDRKITLDDLGSSVGNAEYTTGFLL